MESTVRWEVFSVFFFFEVTNLLFDFFYFLFLEIKSPHLGGAYNTLFPLWRGKAPTKRGPWC